MTRLEQIRERFAAADRLRAEFLGKMEPDDDMSWLLAQADRLAKALEWGAHWDISEHGKPCMPECEEARNALDAYRTAVAP